MKRLLALTLLVAGCQVETGDTDTAVVSDTATARVVTLPQRDLAADTVASATLSADSVAAAPSVPAAAVRRAAADALLDLADRAPTANAQTLARISGAADAQLGALRQRPPELDSLRRVVRSAAQRGDRMGVAVAAARAYRALAASRPDGDPSQLRAEALVVSALAAAPLPDWRALQASAAGLTERWESSRTAVSNAGVQDAMSRAVAGVASGAEGQNVAVVRLGAQVVQELAGSL